MMVDYFLDSLKRIFIMFLNLLNKYAKNFNIQYVQYICLKNKCEKYFICMRMYDEYRALFLYTLDGKYLGLGKFV